MGKTRKFDITAIQALAELDRAGVKYEPRGEDEVIMCCPVPSHADSKPSCSLNVEKNLWKCQSASCGASGTIIDLLAYLLKVDRTTIIDDLATRYDMIIKKTIKLDRVEQYHENLHKAGPLLKSLRERGITDDMCRVARLGYHDNRIMIPVFDRRHQCVNIRKYMPGAAGPEKMRNVPGFSGPHLYREEDLEHNIIWICGGELKALVVGEMLKSHGVGAVAVTAGEGAWDSQFTPSFLNKEVYLCFDIDKGGQEANKRIATQILRSAKSVKIIELPLDPLQYPKGDVNDWVGREGATVGDLLQAMEQAKDYHYEIVREAPLDLAVVSLSNSVAADNLQKRIQVEASIAAMDTTPYFVPRDVLVQCDRDQSGCSNCPIYGMKDNDLGFVPIEVNPASEGMLSMIGTPEKAQRQSLCKSLRIPACKNARFRVTNHHKVFDTRLVPQLNLAAEQAEHIVLPAFIITDDELELNNPYTLTGRVFPHPKNQQAQLLFDTVEQGTDNLSAFNPSKKDLKTLTIFQPTEWTVGGLRSKLHEIYEDYEANVTHIFQRRELHLAVDLAYHSPLFIRFDGRVQNGWLNLCVLGDSSQGKSELTQRYMEHIGLGTRHDCKNATTAGLLGGLDQIGSKWFISWGVIPMNDRRLVMLEEVKGVNQEVLGRLTDMRSSGVAEVNKIEKRRTHARTRLVMISNPRGEKSVAAHSFGVEAIKNLVGSLEDMRRFDLAVILANEQVDLSVINTLNSARDEVKHVYTKDLARRLVLWAWTRTESQITFEKEAIESCMSGAMELCQKFDEGLPLIDKGTTKFKIARLATALAIRTFSCTEDLAGVIVRKCHVNFIVEFILKQYNDPMFGYADFSKAREYQRIIANPKDLESLIINAPHPKEFVDQLMYAETISVFDLRDWCNTEVPKAQEMISTLVRCHALIREEREYSKSSAFISYLKEIRNSGKLEPEAVLQNDLLMTIPTTGGAEF